MPLRRTAATLRLSRAISSSVSVLAERTMTGTGRAVSILRIASSTANPSTSGIIRSRSTRSGSPD